MGTLGGVFAAGGTIGDGGCAELGVLKAPSVKRLGARPSGGSRSGPTQLCVATRHTHAPSQRAARCTIGLDVVGFEGATRPLSYSESAAAASGPN